MVPIPIKVGGRTISRPIPVAPRSGQPSRVESVGGSSGGLQPGTRVRIVENILPVTYANKLGVYIRQHNGEYGIHFGKYNNNNNPVVVWFRPSEVIPR